MTAPQSESHLRPLLEQLNTDELRKFKSLLRVLPQSKLQQTPWSEVEEANGKQLAEILVSDSPSNWTVGIMNALEKMTLTELSKPAMAPEPEYTWNTKAEEAYLQETEDHSDKRELEGELVETTDDPKQGEAEEGLEAEEPDEEERDRNTMEAVSPLWKNKIWPGDSGYFHYNIIQRSRKLIPFLNPKTSMEPTPHTVVLQGAAGVGKTTLAKKLMLDWTEDTLTPTFKCTFYLCCKELNRMGPCTFAELISKDWPELQDAIPEVLAQPQKVLFIIDGFDELRVPSGALIHDICGDWKKEKPVPVLLGSLLKRKMLPEATLLITTRPWALRELQLLVEQLLIVEVDGFLELDRKEYFLKYFKDEDQALRAFDLMRSNVVLFSMGSAPLVCWIVCSCLGLQMEMGEDPTLTCQTTTSLFLHFLCSQFIPAPVTCSHRYLQASLKAICLLAAQGMWTQMSVFDGEDLRRLGVEEEDVCLFLDKNIFQRDKDCEGCYRFIHLSVQQFLAAIFYVLVSKEEEDGGSCQWDIGGVEKLLSKEERLKNPSLIQVGYFLFGLLNEKRVKELETIFDCQMSMEFKQELLRCKAKSDENKPFSSTMGLKELFYCLYESQEEEFVKDVVGHFKEMFLHLTNIFELMYSSFCLKHCQNLQKISLQVEKGIFLENDSASELCSQGERSQSDHLCLSLWMDLCSVLRSNENLSFLEISQSFLSASSVRILCAQIIRGTCSLQKVVIKNVSPADAYRDLCLAFVGKKTLTHLILGGNAQSDMLPLLCEILKHPKCNLQHLRLESCSATTQQWADFASTLRINQSLTCLNLTSNELLDDGVKFLCTTLTHPKCSLQRLSLENCHLTEACCKDLSSALIVNQRLMYLSLAKNKLGDSGVRLLCEGLSYPDCKLQTLVLWQCSMTRCGCKHLSKLLQGNSSLTHLDLGLNPLVPGLQYLCDTLEQPHCNLKSLWLWGCSITPSCCRDLASVLVSNQSLETLDLGHNVLGQSGVVMLLEALKRKNGPLQTLRLKIDESSVEIQKLLKEVKESNPGLTIEWNDARTNRPSCCDFLS
ncbi:NACHT, LRR and PYD domains-containing protein 7-like [Tamandua tetradactyla]|uniref:NACHT, LRR and PYD domains-containing protein 7-like n=1 Tax=Tamandua tetradactyla TaxID=48850 RepID=UPI0040544026